MNKSKASLLWKERTGKQVLQLYRHVCGSQGVQDRLHHSAHPKARGILRKGSSPRNTFQLKELTVEVLQSERFSRREAGKEDA